MNQFFLRRIFSVTETLNRYFSSVGDACFFDEQRFDWVRRLEKAYPLIRSEYQSMVDAERYIPSMSELSGGRNELTDQEHWRVCALILYGQRVADDSGYFPRTYDALSQIPNVRTAFFSILPPTVEIAPHRGPYNGVLRYHMGIVVPEGDSGIRVGEERRQWTPGGSLIFDDSYEHEAWNHTSGTRVVLFVDFMRPLPRFMDYINDRVYKGITKNEFTERFLDNARSVARSHCT